MHGLVGTQTRIGTVLPRAGRIARIVKLSKEARARLKWIDYYHKRGNARATCRHFDISPSLFYKWHNRYKRIGIKGLENVSCRPLHYRQSQVPVEYIDLIRILRKRYPYLSKYKLEVILRRDYDIALSSSAIGRIIKKYNLFFDFPYPEKKKRRHQRERLPSSFKANHPGDLVQSDTKHVPFFGNRRYFYVITDCLTKMASIHVSKNISSRQSRVAFEKVGKHIPYPIRNSQNDNGSENLKELKDYLVDNNIKQYFSRPRTPKDNAFVERLIGTIEREFIQQGGLTDDIEEQQEAIDKWLDRYHNFRPHQALGYLTPRAYYDKIKQEKCSRCIGP